MCKVNSIANVWIFWDSDSTVWNRCYLRRLSLPTNEEWSNDLNQLNILCKIYTNAFVTATSTVYTEVYLKSVKIQVVFISMEHTANQMAQNERKKVIGKKIHGINVITKHLSFYSVLADLLVYFFIEITK